MGFLSFQCVAGSPYTFLSKRRGPGLSASQVQMPGKWVCFHIVSGRMRFTGNAANRIASD